MRFLRKKQKKICVLGNSHVTSLKRYWDESADQHPWDLTFFGAGTPFLRGIVPQKGALECKRIEGKRSFERTSGGQQVIQVNDYAHFCVLGALSGSKVVGLLSEIDAAAERGMPYSSEFIGHLYDQFFDKSLAKVLLEKLRKVTDKPIVLSGGPLPSERIQKQKYVRKITPERQDFCLKLLQDFEIRMENRLEEYDAKFLRWPSAPRVSGLFNQHQYMAGSMALNGGTQEKYPQHDLIHGNAAYGELLATALSF